MFCNSLVVMITQPCEYTKNDLIVHFKLVNFMVYELYFNLKKVRIYQKSTTLGHTTFLSCLKNCSSTLLSCFLSLQQPVCSFEKNQIYFKLSFYFKLCNGFLWHWGQNPNSTSQSTRRLSSGLFTSYFLLLSTWFPKTIVRFFVGSSNIPALFFLGFSSCWRMLARDWECSSLCSSLWPAPPPHHWFRQVIS